MARTQENSSLMRLSLLGLLLLLIWWPGAAEEPVRSAEEARLFPPVAAAYQELADAWRRLDAAGVMSHFASDVKHLDGRHEWTDWAGVKRSVEQALQGATSCQIDYGVHDWRMEGKLCLVVIHQTRVIDYGSKQVTRVVEREDRWAQTDRGWQFCEVRFLRQVSTVTGDTAGVRSPKSR